MRARLWAVALAVALDLFFSDHPADGSSRPLGKQLATPLQRVTGRRRSGRAYGLAAALVPLALGAYLSRNARRQWQMVAGLVDWALLLRLFGRRGWERQRQQAVELLSLDVPSMPVAAVGHTVGCPLVRRALPKLCGIWTFRALGGCPGIRSVMDAAGLDGTLAYTSPMEYLRRAPALLRDILSLLPVPLTAAALVGGAFLKGSSGDDFRVGVTGEGASHPRKDWGRSPAVQASRHAVRKRRR